MSLSTGEYVSLHCSLLSSHFLHLTLITGIWSKSWTLWQIHALGQEFWERPWSQPVFPWSWCQLCIYKETRKQENNLQSSALPSSLCRHRQLRRWGELNPERRKPSFTTYSEEVIYLMERFVYVILDVIVYPSSAKLPFRSSGMRFGVLKHHQTTLSLPLIWEAIIPRAGKWV